MATTSSRGTWNSKLGFIMAAAGGAVGLGNIWRFPTETAENGGAAFLFVYVICCFLIGLPVLVAELSLGRATQRNAVGAFKALSKNPIYQAIGFWGVICGSMILSFYVVIAGWSFSNVFVEIFDYVGMTGPATTLEDTSNGVVNILFASLFMIATIFIVRGGVSEGIERATKTMMPLLLTMLLILIGLTLPMDGAADGVKAYLQPDFSQIDRRLILYALGQSFFSLSLGLGALITYGSYLSRSDNVVQSAAIVTLSDVSIAFIAGLLIIPAIYVAQAQGIQVFDDGGSLIAGPALIFNILPVVFDNIGGIFGLALAVTFFLLLSVAALTSTISLLEVSVSYVIDEFNVARNTATWLMGGIIGTIAIWISFDLGMIDILDTVFSAYGLPIGGLLISLFVGWVWKTPSAMEELKHGFPGFERSFFQKVWPLFIRFVCPILIFLILLDLVTG
ncbi:MAG: sodium-dependent transporter [Balneolaceae bacterium]|nr:sodium-dependent transporter [Balneolaceae bacterium]